VVCIEPNANLYQFDGRLTITGFEQQIELTHKNLLLRGSILKNTQFVIGLVCYTGHRTKIMMNTTDSVENISKVENRLNKFIFGILIFECICCGLSAAFNFINCKKS
jgi:phospholipid-transporting ATPase